MLCLPLPSLPPNLTKLPFEFSDAVRIPSRGMIALLIREITFRLSQLYVITNSQSTPPTLQTDGLTSSHGNTALCVVSRGNNDIRYKTHS